MNAIGGFSIVVAVGIACLPGAARGQPYAPSRAPAVTAAEPIPLTGVSSTAPAIPALFETAAVAEAMTPEPAGPVNLRLLDRDITAKFASLNHCRTDVGGPKWVPPALIPADRLTLRWSIAGKGQVAAMDVVGSTPVYPGVLDCITRETNGWLFSLPGGGDMRLNRGLVFRRLSPPAPRP